MAPYQNFGTYVNPFPRRRFLCMAGIQVAVSMLFIVLASVDTGLQVYRMNHRYGPIDFIMRARDEWQDVEDEDDYSMYDDEPEKWPEYENFGHDEFEDYNVTDYYILEGNGFVILFSVLNLIAGALGLGAARTIVSHRKSGLKNGFLAMNIINALQNWILFLCGGALCYWIHVEEFKFDFHPWRLAYGGILFFLGLALWVLSIVSASVACCCAPVEEVQYVMVPHALPMEPEDEKKLPLA